MRLSREQVKHVALLARLGLTEAEVEKFQQQLSNILENFEILQEVDTTDIPPTAQPIALYSVFREDEIEDSYPLQDILANTPSQENGCFKVRAILEES